MENLVSIKTKSNEMKSPISKGSLSRMFTWIIFANLQSDQAELAFLENEGSLRVAFSCKGSRELKDNMVSEKFNNKITDKKS